MKLLSLLWNIFVVLLAVTGILSLIICIVFSIVLMIYIAREVKD